MADRITGLYTLTIGDTKQNTITVFNASTKTALHWVGFWYAEAKDGRFGPLTIEENGNLDHSAQPTEPSIILNRDDLFRVQTWRSDAAKLSIVHSARRLESIVDLITGCLSNAAKEGVGRLTRVEVTIAPQPVNVPVKSPVRNVTDDAKKVAHAVLRLSNPFGDWAHVVDVVTPDVMAAAGRLASGL